MLKNLHIQHHLILKKEEEENRHMHAMLNVQFYLNPHLYIDFWLFCF